MQYNLCDISKNVPFVLLKRQKVKEIVMMGIESSASNGAARVWKHKSHIQSALFQLDPLKSPLKQMLNHINSRKRNKSKLLLSCWGKTL